MRTRARRLAAAAVAAAALVATAGACQGGGGNQGGTTGKPIKGGTINVAEGASATPNWIWPFASLANFSVINAQLQQPMYRPLYFFGGHNDQPTVDYGLSVANEPQYAADGKSVTIKLKGYKWSNGETVDADGVLFWMHMLKVEKANYAGYTPGAFPDNVTSVEKTAPDTVVMKFDHKYSSDWFTYNELSQVTPMPKAWDIAKDGGAAGSGGCTADASGKKCKAVWKYLNTLAKDQKSYATSKIWSVVNGPFKLSSYNANGHYTIVPNPKYSGTQKARVSKINFLPFTTDSAEYNVLRAGKTLDVAGVPPLNLPQKATTARLPKTNPLAANYNLSPAYRWGVNYFPMNFNNPKFGPVFKQLYIRQALTMTLNQPVVVEKAQRGYAIPNIGPVPPKPDNKFLSDNGRGSGPYGFSTSKAKSLLTSHGWALQGGVMTCTKPGSGASQCGAGVKSGTKLSFPIKYASGAKSLDLQMQQFKSDASKAGIQLQLTSKPFNDVLAEAVVCKPSEKACDWVMDNWGGGWIYSPDYLPTGESLWATGAGSNSGSYSDKKMDKLIQATEYSNDPNAMKAFQDYTIQQLPVIYQPNPTDVFAVSKHVGGVNFNPLNSIVPEYWYRTK